MRRTSWILLFGAALAGLLFVFTRTPATEPVTDPPTRPGLYWSEVPSLRTPYPREALILPRWEVMRVGMDILVDGRPLPTIQHAGRTYLPVPYLGQEYEIRVCNHGPRRITAIVSVDGLSVMNGQPASEVHPGYLVWPHDSIRINGWRRDRDTVAAFRFESRDQSYAYRVGRPENIGVIGLIAIEEQGWLPRLGLKKKDAGPGTRSALGELGGTGTGYGHAIESHVYSVPFVRSANKRTLTIYYDTVDALRRAGVPVDGRLPNPFPGDPLFVPPPPAR